MRTALLALVTVAAAALVAGCLETKQDVTVNPDGSGKTRVEIVMSDVPFSMTPQQDPPDPQVTAKRFAKSVLEKSKGVDAWSDVAFKRTEDNRTRFTGTAYFRDFAAMNLQAGKMKGVTLEKTADGGMVLQVETQQQPGPLTGGRETSPPQATEPEKPMAEEQTQQRLAAERAKWQQMKPMMAMTLGRMKMEATFHLPGTLKEVQGFEKTPDGGVRFVFDGAKVLEVVDKLMADDEYVRKNMLAGKGGMGQPPLDDKALQQLFGTAGALVAKTAGPAKPQFDYAAEVQAAKAAYPAMIQRLGLDQVPADQPGPQLPPGFGLPGGA
ncbi:MAG: hypothetical protein U9R68_09780 [Planctomycetota bacterium]|nr:hypothetical protein [Planctomycetota bacterium]